jgi:hypothetical protein
MKFCGECGAALDAQPIAETGVGGLSEESEHQAPPAVVDYGQVDDRRRPARLWLFAIPAVLLLAVVAVVGFLVLGGSQSKDDKYLSALRDAGRRTEFPTDRAAVIQAQAACERFERTGDPKGGPAAKIAVDIYCPQWADDFKLLRTITVQGTFTVDDFDEYYSLDDGDSCEGEGGYGDMNSSTTVLVTNGDGDVLTRGQLGPGEVSTSTCEFAIEFEVTEGEKQYVVAVGDRGESTYTFEELKNGGVSLVLGD